MEYTIELKETKAQQVLSKRITTTGKDLFKDLDIGFTSILNYLDELDKEPIGPPYALYYNWDLENLEVELGYPVDSKLPEKDGIIPMEIPSGKKASTFYKGPYRKIAPAYKALKDYGKSNELELGVNYENYHTWNQNIMDSELLTEIVYIVKE